MLERKKALELLREALKSEELAYQIYMKQAEGRDGDTKNLLIKTADEEKKHMTTISEIIKKLEKSKDKFV